MSMSSIYLTRRFATMNYRDLAAIGLISTFVTSKTVRYLTASRDNAAVFQHVYTHDETDITFRDTNNMTDSAVRVKKIKEYRAKIEAIRA